MDKSGAGHGSPLSASCLAAGPELRILYPDTNLVYLENSKVFSQIQSVSSRDPY